jgi:hypothetical protein
VLIQCAPASGSLSLVMTIVLKCRGWVCKATATERVQTDLREMLQISCCAKFVSSINRPNLFYEVQLLFNMQTVMNHKKVMVTTKELWLGLVMVLWLTTSNHLRLAVFNKAHFCNNSPFNINM